MTSQASQARRWIAVAAVLMLLPVAAAAQDPVTITGRVTSEAGEPLRSASITIPQLNMVVQANPDGSYRLVVPGARAQGQEVGVTARMLGYRAMTATVTLTAGATITQNFQLTVDPLRLEEVVVTGAGTERLAERLATARASVTQDQVLRANEPNVIAALAQKAPNVVTTQNSGEAGAGTAIRIRGTSTLAGSGEPAIIVDGTPINNASRSTGNPQTGGILGGVVVTNRAFDINPEDIESIEILKGPAAMSILGASAGAGGAILITTRRGQAGVTRYTLRSTMQLDRVSNVVPLQRSFASGTSGNPTACLATPTPGCTHNNPTWGPALASGTPTYDHARELFEQGTMLDNTLSVSGGTELTNFYLSLGALSHDGFIVGGNDSYERYTVRLNADHRVRDNLRIGGNVSYVQSQGSFVSRGNNINGLLLSALRTPPEFNNRTYLDPATGLHRSYRYPMPRAQIDLVANRGFDNPFFAIFEHPNLGEVGRVFGNLNTRWDPLPWLTVNHTLGADYASDDRTEALHVSASGFGSGGSVTRWQFYDRLIDHNLVATARFDVGRNMQGTFSLGQHANETYFRQIFVNGNTLISPQPYKLTNTITRDLPTDSEQRTRLLGFFGQAELDIADQLFLSARLRNDGASTFSENHLRAWYPGASVAWTFTRSLDIPENILSFGKLRLSYGESGQEPGAYQLQNVFTNAAIADFNPGSLLRPSLAGFGGLYTSATRGNPDLRPERVKEIDAGFDLAFMNGMSDLSVTYYNSHAEDVIFTVALPPSTGALAQTANAAEIRNRGWEIVLNARPLHGPTSLNLGLNWSQNDNEVLSLGFIGDEPRLITGFSTSFTGSTTHAEVGHPVGIFRGFGFIRCGISPDQVTATLNISAACAGAPRGAIYLGANGLPVRDPTERVIGNPNPDWTAGFNAELSYRGVRFSAFVDHRQGGDVLNMTRGSLESLGTHRNTEHRAIQDQSYAQIFGVPVVGPGANVVLTGNWAQTYHGGIAGLVTREHLIEDGTFTRLREISIAYTFAGPWVRETMGVSSIDARISGRNLWVNTDYSGFDPEVHTGGSAVANRGIDWFTNPISRAFVFSVALTR